MYSLLIMAAGKASRYGSFKQFEKIGPNGEFLMEYAIKDAISVGIKSLVIVVQKEHINFINNHFKDRLPKEIIFHAISQQLKDVPVKENLLLNRTKPWGTSHVVWLAKELLTDYFIVINADDYYGKDTFLKAKNWIIQQEDKNIFGLLGFKLKDTLSTSGSVSRGICQSHENVLNNIVEVSKLKKKGDIVIDLDNNMEYSGNEITSMNFWILNSLIFPNLEREIENFCLSNASSNLEIKLPNTIQKLIYDKKITVEIVNSTAKWFGMTYSEDKNIVIKNIAKLTNSNVYPSPLW